jgi:hypothetical protein
LQCTGSVVDQRFPDYRRVDIGSLTFAVFSIMPFLGPRGIHLSLLPAFILKMLAIGLIVLAPFWYGAATWDAQQVLFVLGMGMSAIMAIHIVLSLLCGKAIEGPSILTWILFALGGMGFWQAQANYGWHSDGRACPPSVVLQRWALGSEDAPVAISQDLLSSGVRIATDGSLTERSLVPCPLRSVASEHQRLAVSIEPMTSRAAAGNFFLAGLLVWVGSTMFSRRSQYPILLACVALLGVGIASLGLLTSSVSATSDLLGLGGRASFSTFVSRNSAGAFLNVALAAALGFALWAMQRGWARMGVSGLGPLQGDLEASRFPWLRAYVANLDALQIASILAVVWIVAALLVSLSRGAVASCLAAVVATIILVLPSKHRAFALVGALIVAILAIAIMVFFQLDEQVSVRMESLREIDLENESRGGRLYIWNVSRHAALFYGWCGSGLGTFHFASLPFQRPSSIGWFYHAESIYWEVLVTMGYVGAFAVALAIAVIFVSLRGIYVSRRFMDFVPLLVCGVFLLLSQSMHSFVDFSLILPGVYAPAALLMGAALGGRPESQRVIQRLKRGSHDDEGDRSRTPWLLALVYVSLAMASMLALFHGRQAAIPLSVAHAIDLEFEREDQLGLEERSGQRVTTLVARAAERGVTIDECPHLLRLVAESICYDDRKQLWSSRPPESDPRLAWLETTPLLVRLAYERVDASNREAWLRSIGGEARLARLRKANEYYARARARSPLDWHALWGNIFTSFECSTADLAVFAPVVQRTSGHLPQLLTSASTFFNDTLSQEDRLRLWKNSLRVSPVASIGIGRLMSSQYADGSVPVEIFPDDPTYLYNLARDVFTQGSFPKTHQIICRRALDSVGSQTSLPSSVTELLAADIANEVGDLEAEIVHLAQYLQYKPEDIASWVRLTNLHIRAQRWDDANSSLRRLRQADRKHPAIPELSTRIRNRSQNP